MGARANTRNTTTAAGRESVRETVLKCLPELELIGSDDIRKRVIDAWTDALCETDFGSIDDIRGSGRAAGPPVRGGSQSDHLRGVARLSVAIDEALRAVVPEFTSNRDVLVAGALCHDIGKAFEFSAANQQRWEEDPALFGWPSLRHPVYGVHVCLRAGLPEEVAHIVGAHSQEGDNVVRSREALIVHYADHAFWSVLNRAHMLEGYYPMKDPRGPSSAVTN